MWWLATVSPLPSNNWGTNSFFSHEVLRIGKERLLGFWNLGPWTLDLDYGSFGVLAFTHTPAWLRRSAPLFVCTLHLTSSCFRTTLSLQHCPKAIFNTIYLLHLDSVTYGYTGNSSAAQIGDNGTNSELIDCVVTDRIDKTWRLNENNYGSSDINYMMFVFPSLSYIGLPTICRLAHVALGNKNNGTRSTSSATEHIVTSSGAIQHTTKLVSGVARVYFKIQHPNVKSTNNPKVSYVHALLETVVIAGPESNIRKWVYLAVSIKRLRDHLYVFLDLTVLVFGCWTIHVHNLVPLIIPSLSSHPFCLAPWASRGLVYKPCWNYWIFPSDASQLCVSD